MQESIHKLLSNPLWILRFEGSEALTKWLRAQPSMIDWSSVLPDDVKEDGRVSHAFAQVVGSHMKEVADTQVRWPCQQYGVTI